MGSVALASPSAGAELTAACYQKEKQMGFTRSVLGSVLLLTVATTATFAQTTFATITGTVTDPNDAVVPNTTVEAIHLQSNYRYTATSNQAGVYTLAQLRDGTYVLRAKASGFKESVVESIQLVTLDVRRVDVRLEIGAVDTKVSVTAGATLIETDTTYQRYQERQLAFHSTAEHALHVHVVEYGSHRQSDGGDFQSPLCRQPRWAGKLFHRWDQCQLASSQFPGGHDGLHGKL